MVEKYWYKLNNLSTSTLEQTKFLTYKSKILSEKNVKDADFPF